MWNHQSASIENYNDLLESNEKKLERKLSKDLNRHVPEGET